MRLLYYSLALYLSLSSSSTPSTAFASSSAEKDEDGLPILEPCTARSSTSGAFFDLTPLTIPDPSTVSKSKSKNPRPNSWNATGYDYGYNFTLNFCSGVIEDLEEKGGVVGIDEARWRNVSAYYEKGGKVWSMGMQSERPVLRGRKLVLNYTGGSPCGGDEEKRWHGVEDLGRRELKDDDDEDEDDDDDDDGDSKKPPSSSKPDSSTRRKSTLISLLCDRDPLAPQLTLSFVGAGPDECAYFFEARSPHACGGIEVAKQTLSPGGVFGVIVLIAVIVYLVGGCVYSRMVLNQRGWRQMPNYHMWAGMADFFRDLFIILFSSCARFMPSRRGYNRLNGGIAGSGSGSFGRTGRGRDSEAENRLIDELNEEWED